MPCRVEEVVKTVIRVLLLPSGSKHKSSTVSIDTTWQRDQNQKSMSEHHQQPNKSIEIGAFVTKSFALKEQEEGEGESFTIWKSVNIFFSFSRD